MTNSLLIDLEGPVQTVTINRPEVHNALNADVLRDLREAVLRAQDDPKVRAVILTGVGQKAFCSGADLKEVAGLDADRAHAAMRLGQQVMRDIEQAAIPVIAAVNGLALGGGFELVLSSTFTVLAENASFGLPETRLGLIPGYGGTQRLPRAIGPQTAAYLALTGGRLDAERAYALGLSPIAPVPADALLPRAVDVATTIAAGGPWAVRSVLQALEDGRDAPMDAALATETGLAALALAGHESTEGVAAFFERRPASFDDVGGE